MYQVELRYSNSAQTKHMGRTEMYRFSVLSKRVKFCRLDNTVSYMLNTYRIITSGLKLH